MTLTIDQSQSHHHQVPSFASSNNGQNLSNGNLSKLLISTSSSAASAAACLPSPLYPSGMACAPSQSSPLLIIKEEEESSDSILGRNQQVPLSPTSPTADDDVASDAVSVSASPSPSTVDPSACPAIPTDEDTFSASSESKPSPSSSSSLKKSSSLQAEEAGDASKAGSSSVQRKCAYCGTTSTPMWRHGPGDFTNLCNSCGVKWRRGKILSTGDNRHHLCKTSSSVAKKSSSSSSSSSSASSSTTKDSSPTTLVGGSSSSSNKRKHSQMEKKDSAKNTFSTAELFDQFENDADWDLPRTRKARSCARKLWSGRSLSSSDVEDNEALVTAASSSIPPVETATAVPVPSGKRRLSRVASDAAPLRREPASSPHGLAPPSHPSLSAYPHAHHQPSTLPSIQNHHIHPSTFHHQHQQLSVSTSFYPPQQSNDTLVHHLTNEVAHLLEKLSHPLHSSKTSLFTKYLAHDFANGGLRAAWERGEEVEMSVLDIRRETWEALRALVE